MLRVLALTLRLLGNVFLYLGVMLRQVYDVPIFVPLWLEERIERRADEAAGVPGRIGL